jgi:ABC-type antimicrobial peptide transport system permease subunit
MTKNTQITRIFRRYNGLVLLNISGLSLGLAGIIFIAIWVSHELSYDKFYANADRIFRVESLINFTGDPTVWSITPAPVAKALVNEFPEVEDAVVLQAGYQRSLKVDDKLFAADNLYYSEHSYFDIFSTKLIAGDRAKLLSSPGEIVISKRMAAVLFGDKDPIGKTVLFNNSELLTVTGVIENSPNNTHLVVDFLVPFELLKKEGDDVESWGRIDFITYIMLKDNVVPEQFNEKLSKYWQTKITGFSGTLFINPLTRLYLYRDPGFRNIQYPYSNKGPITRVILFSVIGVVLLIIACINFINLSTAFASQRAREIGVRKVNGAARSSLIIQLFGESLLQTLLAVVFALVLVICLLPYFIRVSGVNFSISELFSLKNILIYISLALITGIISGIYPALILSSFNPVKVIKPLPEDAIQGNGLRKILVVIQFGLAIVFIFCILVITRQIAYMQHIDLGFNQDKVMTMYPHVNQKTVDVIAEQIENIPGVKKVALGGNVPVNMGNFNTITKWEGNTAGNSLIFYMMQVDDNYLDLLDIKLSEGRQFYKGTIASDAIVNEAAVKKMELEEPLGKTIWLGEEKYTIVGVVKDFYFHNLKEEVKPVFIYKNKNWWAKRIFVKLGPGNQFRTVDAIVDVIKKNAPGFPVNYMFLDQEINKYYDTERRLSTLINAATILAIVISCIGLFSLTAFTMNKRKKEIGVRKAYGASIPSVLFMLQKDFGRLVLISSVIALPAGYYIMKNWLNSYSSHVKLAPSYFITAFLIIIMISTLTLIYHTLIAANKNPSDTLRNE